MPESQLQRWVGVVFLILCISFASPLTGKPKKVSKHPKISKPHRKTVERKPTAQELLKNPAPLAPAAAFMAPLNVQPRSYFVSGFGLQALQEPGFALQMQYLFSLTPRRKYYLGLEGSFSLFSTGNALVVQPGLWYHWEIYENPAFGFFAGVLLGPAFTSNLAGIAGTTYSVCLDAALIHEVDDLISVVGRFRPSIMGNYFTFSMLFQVAFRFQ